MGTILLHCIFKTYNYENRRKNAFTMTDKSTCLLLNYQFQNIKHLLFVETQLKNIETSRDKKKPGLIGNPNDYQQTIFLCFLYQLLRHTQHVCKVYRERFNSPGNYVSVTWLAYSWYSHKTNQSNSVSKRVWSNGMQGVSYDRYVTSKYCCHIGISRMKIFNQ